MRRVTYSMGLSLDGYIMDGDGRFDWSEPSPEVFAFHIEEIRRVGVHLLGRRLYETMAYWDDPAVAASFGDAEREWAELWNPLPKVVFSRTLKEVDASARLATGGLVEEVERLRAEPGGETDEHGDIAIGGADLATQAAGLGLIDEYQLFVDPVLVGGGTPFFAHDGRREDLELAESRTFQSGTVFLRYRVSR
ncbi:dihydrofolate reductase family protein [Demequina sp. NBRC 110053]|uniref:dihydrofolate reductase family protein n=1 Tax=Demequina sp. NBRC 110053 TaxID=1570342 RepID=UPI0009FF29B8|nr:dihydrofolate reductase family protein [Demequina sp. NBRC 110053]